MPSHKQELLIIGLDGATFKILDPLVKNGNLPHLARILQESYSSVLMSTVPPVTALAWPTIMSGLNPGNHGLLSWHGPLNANLERPLVNSKKINEPMIWHLLNQLGKKVCVFNVPVTYPPQDIDGVMISGMLTPSVEAQFCTPAPLQAELLKEFPGYKTDIEINEDRVINLPEDKLVDFIYGAKETTIMRGEAFRWLLEKDKYDAGIIVFEIIDRLQHFAWDQMVSLSSLKPQAKPESEIELALLSCLQALDEEVGKLIEYIAEDGHVAFVSDHGFGPMRINIHLNDWLRVNNWLKFKNISGSGWHLIRMIGARFKRFIPAR